MFSLLRDRRVQFALGISLLEWVFVAGTAAFGSASQFPLVLTVISVASLVQFGALFLQFQRSPIAKAQQLFRAGRFDEVVSELEKQPEDVQALTLLGNTYRQLGNLTASETALRRAVQLKPTDAFPLYGLGRTLMVQGQFAQAAQYIEQALAHGGRKVLRSELALAHYLNGDLEKAAQTAEKAVRLLQIENYRVLIANYMMYRTKNDQKAVPTMQLTVDGLAYWQAEAERFATTPYGRVLKQEVAHLESLLNKE